MRSGVKVGGASLAAIVCHILVPHDVVSDRTGILAYGKNKKDLCSEHRANERCGNNGSAKPHS